MFLKLIFLILGATQIFALSTTLYYPAEDNAAIIMKVMFGKLNRILQENRQINKNIMEVNTRLDELTKSVQDIKSQSPHQVEENFQNQWNEKLSEIAKSLGPLLTKQECNENHDWTVIQRRHDGSIDFNRSWTEYKKGFGNPSGEFFIGLDKLHNMTSNGQPQELWITLKDFNDQIRYAIYDNFEIGSEAEKYAIKELGNYRGTAGDSLNYHKGLEFSTKDEGTCSDRFQGAWWFKNGLLEQCYASNLNGPYLSGINPTGGAVWGSFHGWNYSLKSIEMSIRPAMLNSH